jgi:hypothetical protein
MNRYRSTSAVGRLIGTTGANILAMIACGKLRPPERGPSGAYLWTPLDIGRARAALKNDRRRKRKGVATATG